MAEPLFVSIAAFGGGGAGGFSQAVGPICAQLRAGGGILESLAPGLDILGTPALKGRVIVIDPTGLKKYELLRTRLVEAGDRSIPKTRLHVPLNEVSFAKYTRTRPTEEKGPDTAPNPMIGPNPFAEHDSHAPVSITFGGKTVSGTFLLDTGAATSMISTAKAREAGLKINRDGGIVGVEADEQFALSVGGLGGIKDAKGIFFEQLSVPTREGRPIIFRRAPLLVSDVTLKDAEGKTFTLDGVLGMNYLVGSAEVAGGLMPDIGKIVEGPWKSIVIDLKRDELGLEPR